MTVVILPGARRCRHVNEDGERCITYLEARNSGPECHAHTRRVRRDSSPSPERLARSLPTPTAEAVAAGLASLGVEVAA